MDKPEPYAVPVKCNVPEVHCTWEGTDVEVLIGVMKCLSDYKRANEVCRQK